MNQAFFIFLTCALTFMQAISRAESVEQIHQSLKVAELKLACCCKEASNSRTDMGRPDLDLVFKKSQAAWEKYREAEVAFEMGDVHRDDDETGKQYYAAIMLRVTNERIEAIQRAFQYTLCNPSEIRIRNGSNVDFKEVIVGDKKYGDIQHGATTNYQRWGVAYRYSFVSLTVDSKPLKILPSDYTGETPLGEGKFTYVLTIENDQLDIQPITDTP